MYCDIGSMTQHHLRRLVDYLRGRLAFEMNQNEKLKNYLELVEPGFNADSIVDVL